MKPFHRKVMLGLAVLAAAGLGTGLTAGLASAAGHLGPSSGIELYTATYLAIQPFPPRSAREATVIISAADGPAAHNLAVTIGADLGMSLEHLYIVSG